MAKRILVIDDDPQYIDQLRSHLGEAGYQVALAFDGEAGLARARETPAPDLVLSDVLLPRRDGFSICRALKEDDATRDLPVVLMSAVYLGDADRERGLRLGADGFVAKPDAVVDKPIRFDELLGHIAHLLGDAEAPDAERPITLLLVEDDPPGRRMLTLTLSHRDYRVLEAANGREALELLATHPVDLVLSDIQMPVMSGLELLAEVRKSYPDLVVVMMTAYGSEEIAVEAMKLGANDYLTKPIKTRELGVVLRENLEKHRLAVERARYLEQLKETSRELIVRVELLERQNRLLAASRRSLEEVNQARADLVATIAHEIKSPLTVITGTHDLLLEDDNMPLDERRRMLEGAQDQALRLGRLTNELLELERIQAGAKTLEIETLDLRTELKRVLEILRPAALRAELELRLIAAPAQAPTEIDREAFERILSNLVGNAIKFSPAGETIEVRLDADDGDWRIVVADRGPGVPEDLKASIFERFVSRRGGNLPTSSTGLGLWIVRSLVKLHGGEVGLEDRAEGGTEMWLRLPGNRAEPEEEHPYKIAAVSLPESLVARLGEAGLELSIYPSAQELLADPHAVFERVLIDLKPPATARRLFSLLRRLGEQIPPPRTCILPTEGGTVDPEAARLFDFVHLFAERPSADVLVRLCRGD